MIEVKVTMKDGDWDWINPVMNVTITNDSGDWEFKPEDIKSIEIYEIDNDDDGWNKGR